MILVGSHAINHHLPGFRPRPVDVDVIATPAEIDGLLALGWTEFQRGPNKVVLHSGLGDIWEAEIASELTEGIPLVDERRYFPVLVPSHLLTTEQLEARMPICELRVPTLDALYTLKMSHRYLKDSPHFAKTMQDIHRLRGLGCQVHDHLWLHAREKATYSYQHPNLNRPKTEFFRGDAVTYLYDHDSLHQAVKLEDVPAYTRFSTPGQEVLSSRERFDALSETHRLQAVLEESYVLALERSQIPFAGQISANDSFRIALEKVCTSITSGWFRTYAWENYYLVLMMYRPDYLARFAHGLATGVVKLAAVPV